MRADASFAAYLGRLPSRVRVLTSTVVEGEILFGISRMREGRRKTQLRNALADVLGGLDSILPVTRNIASRYAVMKAAMWARGMPMGENDMWIAATSLVHELVLVTSDGAFAHVPGLQHEDWS